MTVKRGRGPGRPVLSNLRNNPGPRLTEGERNRTHRVRAPEDVHAWFGAMTALERGQLLARMRAMATDPTTSPATAALVERDAATVEAAIERGHTSTFDVLALETARIFDDVPARAARPRTSTSTALTASQRQLLATLASGSRLVWSPLAVDVESADGARTRVPKRSTAARLQALGLVDDDGRITTKGRELLEV